jgi:hypothetical protein
VLVLKALSGIDMGIVENVEAEDRNDSRGVLGGMMVEILSPIT